jgi:uncharacterized protein (AIM24 family)
MKTNFLQETEFKKIVGKKGNFNVIEYTRDISVTPDRVVSEYYAGEMNVRRRQVAITLNNSEVVVQTGAMQWTAGDVQAATNIKGAGDLAKKMLSASVTKESAIKPKYLGSGLLVLEPTYKHLILIDIETWQDGIVMDDGLFLACDASVQLKTVARSTLSSAVLGNEGLFNTMLIGHGVAVLESPVPASELVLVSLENDTLKVDGNYAVAWSNSLKFTVEKTTKTLIGSAASGEGFVNVYSGTGKVLLAPIR